MEKQRTNTRRLQNIDLHTIPVLKIVSSVHQPGGLKVHAPFIDNYIFSLIFQRLCSFILCYYISGWDL